jgi:hypothetical protein
VAYVVSIVSNLSDQDSPWLDIFTTHKNVQYLLNRRQLLLNLELVRNAVADIQFPEKDALLIQLDDLVRVEREIIINRENFKNKTFGNKVLETIELGAAIAIVGGAFSMFTGGLMSVYGYCLCSKSALATGGTLVSGGGKASLGGFFIGNVAEFAKTPEPRGMRPNPA